MEIILLFLIAFLFGAIPFSYIIGKLFKKDIREYGEDRNPGPANSFKAGGPIIGIPSLILDFLKGAIPVSLIINNFNLSPAQFVCISVAPVLGHIFTPFLRFRGGKGITTTFGIWSALTLWEVPTFMGGLFFVFLLFKKFLKINITDSLIVIFSAIVLVIFIYYRYFDIRLTAIALINSSLLIFAQFKERFIR